MPLLCPDPALPTTPEAVAYYVCDCAAGADPACVTGSDSAAGNSPVAPWRSYAKARAKFESGAFPAGTSIAFCRGGAWDVPPEAGDSWVNSACTAAKPCVIRDYLPGGLTTAATPILRFAGRNGFRLEDGGNSNHEAGLLFLNLELRGSGVGKGFFFFNDQDDVLMCGLTIDAFDIGVHVAGSNAPANASSNALNERIVLRNSLVTNCPNQGWLGGGNYNGIEFSTFRNNGFGLANLNHNVYLSGSSGTTDKGLHIIGSDLYQSTFIDGKCQGVSLVSHGRHDDMLIDGNSVHEDPGTAAPGCWGIAADTDSDPRRVNAFNRLIVQNNTVTNVGNVGIGVSSCADCTVQNNLVIADQTAFGTLAISIPDKAPSPPDLTLTNILVRNNTILLGANAPASTGIVLEGQGGGHSVVSNAVLYLGSDAATACFSFGLPKSAYGKIDYNLCHTPNAPGAEWERGGGALGAWQATGFDANSSSAAPLFTSEVAPLNLQPRVDSPLVNAGDATSFPALDQRGKARSNPPEIGAIER